MFGGTKMSIGISAKGIPCQFPTIVPPLLYKKETNPSVPLCQNAAFCQPFCHIPNKLVLSFLNIAFCKGPKKSEKN